MSSYRQQILDNLADRLSQIAPGHQFALNGGVHTCQSTINKVQAWRKNPYTVADLPAICWRDQVTKQQAEEFGKWYLFKMRVVFAAYLAGQTASSQAREVLADMLAAVGSNVRCSGLARKTEVNQASLVMGQKADIIAGARLDLVISYIPANADAEPVSENVLTASGEVLTADGETLEW